MGYVSIYVEVNIISIVLLVYLLARLNVNYGTVLEVRALKWLSYVLVILAIMDIMWVLGEHTSLPYTREANNLINVLYMLTNGLASYMWLIYNEQKLDKWNTFSRATRFLISLPFWIYAFMVIASVKTGWIFYVDDNNHFHDGNLRIFQGIMTLSYLIAAAIHAMIRASHETVRTQKSEYVALASFFILPLTFSVVHFFLPDIPYAAIGSTLAMLFVYNRVQDNRIFSDVLTGLNNRRRSDEYFDLKIVDYNPNMVFMLGDINKFKYINDNFGHAEGDRALIMVSGVLKAVCNEFGAFLARYGGDEFSIIWENRDERTEEQFIDRIDEKLYEASEKAHLPYPLTMSFGYARADGRLTGSQILDIADKMMYERKVEAHKKMENGI